MGAEKCGGPKLRAQVEGNSKKNFSIIDFLQQSVKQKLFVLEN
jgi:hypothetical protein